LALNVPRWSDHREHEIGVPGGHACSGHNGIRSAAGSVRGVIASEKRAAVVGTVMSGLLTGIVLTRSVSAALPGTLGCAV